MRLSRALLVRYELPEQHEPLLVLLPPYSEEGHVSLTKEIRGRRATGATTALVANEDLFAMARDKGVLDEGPEQSSSKGTPLSSGIMM